MTPPTNQPSRDEPAEIPSAAAFEALRAENAALRENHRQAEPASSCEGAV